MHTSTDIALEWHAACLMEVADISSIALKRLEDERVIVFAVGDGVQLLEVTHVRTKLMLYTDSLTNIATEVS